jgi:mannose-6-phosphate isomerase-like protein (cupin superfamily)
MSTEFDNVSVVTRLERKKRAKHLLESIDGPPVPTVPGFVIGGDENNGPIKNTGSRCPFTEIRYVDLEAGSNFNPTKLTNNEHWLVDIGKIQLNLDGADVELVQGDVAMIKTGTIRQISATNHTKVCLVQEKPNSINI